MQDRECLALRLQSDRLQLLDQSRLPQVQDWFAVDDVDTLIEAIHALRTRGAPMIAIAAALLVAVRVQHGDEHAAIADAIERLRTARPTAVNLMHAMDALRAALDGDDWRVAVVATAEALFDDDRALCNAMAEHGAALVAPGERILTHCNTGGLATAGIGTALGVIRRAHEQDKGISVWVDETRPLLQGGRLTAWELGELGIDYRLIADSMAASFMAAGQVDRVIVGADRIAANGDFANKIGTYGLAVLARHHGIPFAVVAPHTTVDPACSSGDAIPIEQRDAAEVRGVTGAAGELCWAPANARVANPAFDVTPAALIDHWVLDTGVYEHAAVAEGVFGPKTTAARRNMG
ncbi:methylthioribose-1-phosphate isomerase [Salinisphaera dokdonensis CL-ES53]|uniref:Methylthioribose-1-phosphate isomerase n=1 Tax=Salinisphaera dokdonensis CL-ES53 TaxID=1304272 RepID=A0ABV2B040_9GAMM